ncbi:nuclear transport factor 2 family protein [Aurantiacibacter flavus]|uniref:Nuclear transport factor 2 family protein n=1 Tax=Aurantiacibacter flavus TaxID=3145232 RepID=A0ABV0CXT4_9SPHN
MKVPMAFAVGTLVLLAACDQAGGEPAPEVLDQADERAQLEANKRLVLDMWHEVLDGQNFDAVRRYISSDYIQHSPGIEGGRDGLIEYLETSRPDAEPLEPGTYPLTEFEFVLAEGDLVQLMHQRQLPSRDDPDTLVPVWWYDTYRIEDGMIVEHWDSIHR